MNEYDFEDELRRLYGSSASAVHYQSTDAALRRAYAAGQASREIDDLPHLVTLAAGIESGRTVQMTSAEIAAYTYDMLTALKAQAGAK